tara:strand:+ start:41 stop:550 length:510 start_codon:yes stop_codon:yes gene_type:complete
MTIYADHIFPSGGEAGHGGGIVQVARAFHTSGLSYSMNNTYHTANMSVSITPRSSSNKILIMWDINVATTSSSGGYFLGIRRSAPNASNIVDASATNAWGVTPTGGLSNGNLQSVNVPMFWIDEPNTTSTCTYSPRLYGVSGTSTMYLNRTHSYNSGGRSQMLLFEVSS